MKKPTGTNAFRRTVHRLNDDIKKVHKSLKKQGIPATILVSQAHEVYQKYKGRCAFCGLPLNVREILGANALFYIFYTPIEYGGAITTENLISVCSEHYNSYRASRTPREDIPDLNTFADTIEQLIKTVFLFEKEPTKVLLEKLRRLKTSLNLKMEDIALNMRYKPFKDWTPEQFEIIQDGVNSFPELIEKLTSDTVRHEDQTALDSDKQAITNQIKQIIKTKQYKVIK